MKKNLLLLFTSLLVALCANAQVSVCGVNPDDNGHFDCPYIKSGSVTWNATSKTLTLNNAVVEYSSNNPQDGIRPLRVTSDATIVVHGNCRLTSTGHVAIAIDSYNSKNVTIKGDGTLITSSNWIDIFLVVARLTIKDITLNTVKGIANNAEGNGIALTFDNVQATIMGEVARIGEGITFNNCAITYPKDAYIEQSSYGYSIYCGNHQSPDKIIISRSGGIKGDVNYDGEVNIADVNAVINVILGDGGNITAADVNDDDEVNIADVNVIINIILGDGSTPMVIETFTANGVEFKMVKVDGGTFTMGATPEQGDDAYSSEKPAHQVTLSSYRIGQTEVTQELWTAVMGYNWSHFTGDMNLPADQLSWSECQEFITKLNQLTGKTFRMPTEAEWEYAARGGKQSKGYKYAGSNNIDEVAWYDDGNSPCATKPVATKKPNELGLYDMSGNVMEWCSDWYGPYSSEAQIDPVGPETGTDRITRGGCYSFSLPRMCRVSARRYYSPTFEAPANGLRLAL